MATTNAVNIGKGHASGMFYTATAGTAIPTSLSSIPSAWAEAGYVSEDGMELELSRDIENIKDWSNTVRRVVLTDHEEKASGTCISTTGTALADIFGTTNVSATTASTTVNLSDSDLPPVAAYLWVMKDGDDLMAFGCSYGQIAVTGNISFKAGDVIAWPFEVTAQGTSGMEFIKVNGA